MKQSFCVLGAMMFMAFSAMAQPFVKPAHEAWNTDSLGNHRLVLRFSGTGEYAHVKAEWRRRDSAVANKRLIVQDAKTGATIKNVKTGLLNNETGEFYFEPVSGSGLYYAYYMPFKNAGRENYPQSKYLEPENTASENWLKALPAEVPVNTKVLQMEAVDMLNSFDPMERVATEKELSQLLQNHAGKNYLVFPEDREHSIRMKDQLPQRWIQKGSTTVFKGEAARGEYYAYQLGVYALRNLQGLTVRFTDLTNAQGNRIAAANMSCINNGGIDYTGASMVKNVDVLKGKVQAMWCGVQVPAQAKPGLYKGMAVLKAKGLPPVSIAINITVNNKLLSDGGASEPWKMTRLNWLNSTLAQANEVIAPYTALQKNGNSISLLGRKLELNEDGLPGQIQTFFTPEMTGYQAEANNLLVEPFRFLAVDAEGQTLNWKNNGLKFTTVENGIVKWKAVNSAPALQMEVSGSLEFDGFVSYKIKITAKQDVELTDLALNMPLQPAFAKYMLGLGQKGGNRAPRLTWNWDVAHKNQDGAWLGNVNGGLQFSLRDEHYSRPLNTNFYLQKPLLLPASWGNHNKGGINIAELNGRVVVNNYSGSRSMKKGDTLHYDFTLLITPFHPLNTDFQWENRFFHKYENPDTVKANGATVINIHHANDINPWINYPFIEHAKMKAYINMAHARGLKVKIYNTVRELSNHAYETYALRSLGHEVYSPGKGGGYSWLQEHLGNDYIAAWFVPAIKDAAIVNSGMNRWHNYYVEGMNWLVQNVGIDGIYLDDVAFDRVTMKRIKRVLTKDGHPGIIDLHSANQFNKSDGFNNSANLYMEHFPYLNRLWFGEYFDYEKSGPDFFLTEISGIPFGLMGEMLQDGGNPWRGMLYGMTNRYPWSQEADPRAIWKLWSEFGMKGSEMIGYWSPSCPVKTNNEQVLATVYKKKGTALISLASWADTDTQVQLDIDWSALGIDPAKASISATAVENFQPAASFAAGQAIPVQKGKGWLLTVK